MAIENIVKSDKFIAAIKKYRSMCFWNLAADFIPKNRSEIMLAIENLEKYGDLKAYKLAGEIRAWL